MNLNDVIFVDSLPKIDLHGMPRDIATIYIKDFINENKKLKNEIILIVHGIGSGILKQATHEFLRKHKDVIDFKTYYYNIGATIVKINIEN